MKSEKRSKINKLTLAKRITDILLTVLLFCLMAYQVTGGKLHEWIGIGMTAAFIFHHILNTNWYKSFLYGKYPMFRICMVLINTLLLISIALTAFSGMNMSYYAVPFMNGIASNFFASRMHLSMSYWSFVLMGIHIGMHVRMLFTGILKEKAVRIISYVLLALLSVVGFVIFLRAGIIDYLLFKMPFAFFDYEKSALAVFLENALMLMPWVFAGALISLLSLRQSARNQE